MDRIELAEFAKVSENKENPAEFTADVQEQGIEQGSLIVSRLYNTMLGAITRVLKSWDAELSAVLEGAGFTPSSLTNVQLYNSILKLIKENTNGLQIGDIIPNAGTKVPAGRMLCNGQWIQNCNTLFPDFYNYVLNNTPYVTSAVYDKNVSTYGQCGFMAVDGNNVRLPLITRPISGITNASQCGQAVLDTMRPITGSVGSKQEPAVYEGAFCQGPIRGGVGRFYKSDTTYSTSFDSGRLGARYNGTETRGKQVQYPYSIQVYTAPVQQSMIDVSELVNLIKTQYQVGMQALTATSGSIQLSSGGIYNVTLTGNTQFVLPSVTDTSILNQILIQMNIAEDISIDWGTTNYFSGEPSVAPGNYNVIYEYDVIQRAWVVGQIEKV